MRPEGERSATWMARRHGQIEATLAHLESRLDELSDWTIGPLAVACVWSYLGFRFGDLRWESQYPALSTWYSIQAERPCLSQTVPH
jgi:glutathione S-transferase